MMSLRRILKKQFEFRSKNSETISASFSTLPSKDDKKSLNNEPSSSSNFLNRTKLLAPGVLSSMGVASLGFASADQLGSMLLAAQGLGIENMASPISGIPCAIIIGMGIGNMLPEKYVNVIKPGISYCSSTILRFGIVCVGLKLSIVDVATFGLTGIPVVMTSMATGLTVIPMMARKAGLSEKLGSLLACGTSICGVTAITAASPIIKADSKDTATAIANVVAFGTIGMLTYPYLTHYIFTTPSIAASQEIGMFLGTSIHDTSQVLGSAMTYKQIYGDELVLKIAAITKLTRNLCLVGVMPALGWQYREKEEEVLEASASAAASNNTKSSGGSSPSSGMTFAQIQKLVPGFVLGFVGASLFRSIGDYSLVTMDSHLAYGLLEASQFNYITSFFGGTVSNYALGIAMAGVGLGTNIKALKGVGFMPFLVGFSGCVVVGGTSFTLINILSHFGFM
jgi:uncharacterized integral membrane protein (TIGR00698 family)